MKKIEKYKVLVSVVISSIVVIPLILNLIFTLQNQYNGLSTKMDGYFENIVDDMEEIKVDANEIARSVLSQIIFIDNFTEMKSEEEIENYFSKMTKNYSWVDNIYLYNEGIFIGESQTRPETLKIIAENDANIEMNKIFSSEIFIDSNKNIVQSIITKTINPANKKEMYLIIDANINKKVSALMKSSHKKNMDFMLEKDGELYLGENKYSVEAKENLKNFSMGINKKDTIKLDGKKHIIYKESFTPDYNNLVLIDNEYVSSHRRNTVIGHFIRLIIFLLIALLIGFKVVSIFYNELENIARYVTTLNGKYIIHRKTPKIDVKEFNDIYAELKEIEEKIAKNKHWTGLNNLNDIEIETAKLQNQMYRFKENIKDRIKEIQGNLEYSITINMSTAEDIYLINNAMKTFKLRQNIIDDNLFEINRYLENTNDSECKKVVSDKIKTLVEEINQMNKEIENIATSKINVDQSVFKIKRSNDDMNIIIKEMNDDIVLLTHSYEEFKRLIVK